MGCQRVRSWVKHQQASELQVHRPLALTLYYRHVTSVTLHDSWFWTFGLVLRVGWRQQWSFSKQPRLSGIVWRVSNCHFYYFFSVKF